MLIEINLAPGASAAKLGSGRLPAIRLPSLPAIDGDLRLFAGGATALALLTLALLGYWRMGGTEAALQGRVQQEVTDSLRYSQTIALIQSLQARQDTVAQKIDVIRSADSRRFVWPHLLDEISRAIPAFAWLTQISSTDGEAGVATGPVFTLQGYAGSTQALTRFMKNLESSPYIMEVVLITSEQDVEDGRTVQRFSLEARYEVPDASAIITIPVLGLDRSWQS